jgi:hypothetical protein
MLGCILDDIKGKKCTKSPAKTLRKSLVQGLLVVLLFTFIRVTIDDAVPNLKSVGLFLAVWTPIVFAMNALDMEFADQTMRVATWLLASRVFNVLI